MLKPSIIQGLAEGAAESLTKFFLEKFNSGSKKSTSSAAGIIQDYLENRKIKQEKVNQFVERFLSPSWEETEKLQQRLEQAKQNRKKKRGEAK